MKSPIVLWRFASVVSACLMVISMTSCGRADAPAAAPASPSRGSAESVAPPTSSSRAAQSSHDDRAASGKSGATSKGAGEHQITYDFTTEVTVEPACVKRLGKVTMSLVYKPKTAVAYQAFYSDQKSGAEPPYGAGYGGNDKGITDPGGQYSSTWVVGADAPPGAGRVQVVMVWSGHFGKAEGHFGVADPIRGC